MLGTTQAEAEATAQQRIDALRSRLQHALISLPAQAPSGAASGVAAGTHGGCKFYAALRSLLTGHRPRFVLDTKFRDASQRELYDTSSDNYCRGPPLLKEAIHWLAGQNDVWIAARRAGQAAGEEAPPPAVCRLERARMLPERAVPAECEAAAKCVALIAAIPTGALRRLREGSSTRGATALEAEGVAGSPVSTVGGEQQDAGAGQLSKGEGGRAVYAAAVCVRAWSEIRTVAQRAELELAAAEAALASERTAAEERVAWLKERLGQ